DAGVSPGLYSFEYELCEAAAPSRCDTATISLTVAAPPPIANDDSGSIASGVGGTAVANVLANDTLHDGTPATLADVMLQFQGSTPSPSPYSFYVTLDSSDGSVDVVPTAPDGTYVL